MAETSFDRFAEEYDKVNQDSGDYTHANTSDPALFECIGDVNGKKIYDVACGNGYISRRLVREDATEVWASDISEKLVQLASERYENPDNKIKYLVRSAEDTTDIPKNYFDMVVMNMALHYVKDLNYFFGEINGLLKKGGSFVFTTNHPLRDLARLEMGFSDYNEGKVLDRARKYLDVFSDITGNLWTGEKDVLIYRAPISEIINMSAKNGLLVERMIEPATKTTYGDDNKVTESPIPILYAMKVTKV